MVTCTIFRAIRDKYTDKKLEFEEFSEFEDLLYKLSERETFKPTKDQGFVGAHLISPAVYKAGTTRANNNVKYWDSWAALDVDDYEGSFEDILEKFGDYYYVCYSTGSSTKEHPKFRLVFPLECAVKADKIPHFWHSLNSEFLDIVDAQTKDLSRMFYIPGIYPGAYNFIFTHKGPVIDPYDLMSKYPMHERSKNSNLLENLPLEMQKKIIDKKRSELSRDLTWNSYKDCPFVKKDLIFEYKSITGTGWYYKMYQILVSIAATAIHRGYDIQKEDIAKLAREIDLDTGGWYKDRDLLMEADRALTWVYTNSIK